MSDQGILKNRSEEKVWVTRDEYVDRVHSLVERAGRGERIVVTDENGVTRLIVGCEPGEHSTLLDDD